ncbi:PREDICTED: transmembrane protein 186 [Dufourea novaeangliae]|uniref:transmembrane protein 186 n=1 Tax=Dufourea novaeangliae TaxID=178035 RepID=UPI000766FC26|nr:PREDICTED: transmembrane protein 186 [Dufourea novaeangliae]
MRASRFRLTANISEMELQIAKRQITDQQDIIPKKKSQIFPDYEIIYSFPKIKYLAMLNLAKRNQTIMCGACILPCVGLQWIGFISPSGCETILLLSCWFTISIHIATILLTNAVGYIYFNEKNQQVIVSYLSYWGKRIDLKTDIENIIPISECRKNVFYMVYRVLMIKNCKHNLKLTIPYGQTVQKEYMAYILGI